MRKSFLSIGDFSKRVGVSPEFLKFYEKKGLVKPAWKDDRAYRYYGEYQTTHFMEYQQLSAMGVSLEDAKVIQEQASLSERLEIYNSACEATKREIQELELRLKQFQDSSNAISNIVNGKGWRIEESLGGYFICIKNIEPVPDEQGKRNAFWKDYFSMNISQYVTLKDKNALRLEEGNFTRMWGAIQPYTSYEYEQMKEDPNLTIIPLPVGKCFVYEHSIPTEYDEEGKLSDKVWDLSEPLKLLKDNGLKNKGTIWQKRLCVSHEENGEFLQVQTIIPIE